MAASTEHLSEKELLAQLEEAKKIVKIGAVYTHYRDPKSRYRVTNLAIIEATEEVGILYCKETGSDTLTSITWVRPLGSWTEQISLNNSMVPRFEELLSEGDSPLR